MAYEIPGFSFPLPAGADFSSTNQFRAVKVNSSGQAVVPSAGGPIVGIRQNKPSSGKATTIVHSGVSIVEVSAAVTAGQQVKVDTNGCVLPATTTTIAVGIALETATASGQQIAVLLYPGNQFNALS